MRTLLVAPYPRSSESHGEEGLGGVASYSRSLALALARAGAGGVRVLSPRTDRVAPDRFDGLVEVRETPHGRAGALVERLEAAARGMDVVHVQFEQHLYGGPAVNLRLFTALRAMRERRRVVLTLHQVPDLAAIDGAFLRENGFPAFAPAARAWLRRQYALAARAADLLLVHEPAFAQRLVEQYGVPDAQVAVVPHGVDADEMPLAPAAAKERLGIPRDSTLFLYFGFVTGYKGVDLLASALDGAPHALRARSRVVVAGKVPERKLRSARFRAASEALEESLARLAPWVERKGFLSASDVRLHLAAADAVVFPYRQALSASGPLHLTMGAGKPALASDVFRGMGVPEEGLFARTPESLRSKLQEFLDDPSLAETLREAALARRAEASWPLVATRTRRLYGHLVEGTA